MSSTICLLIGGNGFIGMNLTQRLLEENYEVISYDSGKPKTSSNKVKYVDGSIENTSLLTEVASSAHVIIWLVHTSVPATSMFDVESDLSSNIPPLIRFIQLLPKKFSGRKFIYLSSGGTVYGDSPDRIALPETASKDPISSYGLTKLIAEEYLTFFLKRSPISTFILRPSNVYGRYQNLNKPQGIIGHIFKSLIVGQPINIYGDGSIIRDYIHVKDLAEAVVLCLKSPNHSPFPLVLNIGSGHETSISNMINMISTITKLPIDINRMPERDFDCKFNVLSTEKAANEIGWQSKIELQHGLEDVWDWIQSDLKSL